MVQITVGDEQRTFHVHMDLLMQHSKYFKISLNSKFVEGRTKQVVLEDDNADAFHLFVQWLYNGEYNVTKARSVEIGGCEEVYYGFHAEAYALGNKLVAPAFKIYIVKKLLKVLGRFDEVSITILMEMVDIMYEGTSKEDGYDIRMVLATYCANRIGKTRPKRGSRSQGFPQSFSGDELADLALTNQTSFLYDVFLLIPTGPTFIATDLQDALYAGM